jgi:hypothetical protein
MLEFRNKLETIKEKRKEKKKGSYLLGVFFSTEGPQDKNTFGKIIQRPVEAIINLDSASQDKDLAYKQRYRMPELNSFGSD